MLLTQQAHINEALDLYKRILGQKIDTCKHFGILEDGVLKAAASVKCYYGHWYLRCCVVKPEFRGKGLQRRLIEERLDYLAERTDLVRVSVCPDNVHSIRNIEEEGFQFEKTRRFDTGKIVRVYRKDLD